MEKEAFARQIKIKMERDGEETHQSARVRHEENLAVLGEGDPVRHRCIWENLRNLPVIWRDAVHGVPVKLHSLGVSDEDAPAGHVGRRHEQLLPHAPLNLEKREYIKQMLL